MYMYWDLMGLAKKGGGGKGQLIKTKKNREREKWRKQMHRDSTTRST